MAVAAEQPGFLFGGKTGLTQTQLARRRQVLDAMLARQAGDAPRNVGEGLNALGQGILNGIEGRRLDRAEKEIGERQGKLWSELAGAMGSGGGGLGYGSATGPIGSSSEAPQGTVSIPTGERASYIRSGLVSRGLPEHIADGFVANFQDESGLDPGINEKNPLVPGSRGGFGLYQLTGPRRDAYEAYAAQRGVNPSDVDPQLDFLIDELRGPEAKAAESIFAAKDTAGAAQAIVNNFLRPAPEHRASRSARYSRLGNAAPIEVASLDPSAGMDAIPAPTPRAALERAQATVNARAPAEFGAQDVTALQARPRDPQAVPYEGPGSTIDPRDVRGLVPYTGPALNDPNAAISIAPAGMPGSSPENEEAIRRFHAENGTTPTQYGQGTPRAPLPGSVVGDAGGMQSSAGAPVPMPSPSPRAALERAAGALPPDHPASASSQAASAIIAGDPGRVVQEPGQAPRTAVPGVNPATGMRDDASLGGNNGALRMAGHSSESPRDQIARVMMERGISAGGAPASSAGGSLAGSSYTPEPSQSPAVQRVAQAMDPTQRAPDNRQAAALRILQSPDASPEMRDAAQGLLQQVQQERQLAARQQYDRMTLQEQRQYDERVRQQGFAREDERFAVTDRREDTRLRMEMEKAAREGREPINVNGVLVDPQTFQPVYQAPQQPFTLQPGETRFDGAGNQIAAGGEKPGFRQATPEEAKSYGAPSGQFGPDGRFYPEGVKGRVGGVTVSPDGTIQVGGGNGTKFNEKTEEAAAVRLNDIVQGGAGAAQMLGDVQQLADLGRQIGTGLGAQVMVRLGPYAEAMGISVEGLAPAQAYQSIIARMAPQMRPAGSGASSDFDARQFLDSLPSLGNTPEGNQLITDTFAALQQNKLQAAEIASQAYIPVDQGGIPWQEAERRIRSLPNPYERFKATRERAGSSSAPQDTTPRQDGVPVGGNGGTPIERARNPQTGQILELRNGQWVEVR